MQTIINTRETIKGTRADDNLFSEVNDVSRGLLRSIQFTLQVILLNYCILVYGGNTFDFRGPR